MGPPFFTAEDPVVDPHRCFFRRASMGPPFFTAEDTCQVAKRPPSSTRFNGAAVLHGGRHPTQGLAAAPRVCFNGAAVLHGGRHATAIAPDAALFALQWGRRSSRRKT